MFPIADLHARQYFVAIRTVEENIKSKDISRAIFLQYKNQILRIYFKFFMYMCVIIYIISLDSNAVTSVRRWLRFYELTTITNSNITLYLPIPAAE